MLIFPPTAVFPVVLKLPPTAVLPVVLILANVLAPAIVCVPVVMIPGLVPSAGLRLISPPLVIVRPLAVAIELTVPSVTAGEALSTAQAPERETNNCPSVPGLSEVIADVPVPTSKAALVSVVAPVPPCATPTVPVEVNTFEASVKITLEAVKLVFVCVPVMLRFPPTVALPVVLKFPPTAVLPVVLILANVLAPAMVCVPVVMIPPFVASAATG